MNYIVASTSPDVVKNECHLISHIIGENTLANANSLEEALAQCTAQCRYGCIHGVIGAEVQKELGAEYPDNDLAHADLPTIERIGSPYCSTSSQLCHGVGHVLYIASQNYPLSLAACDAIGATHKESCYQGVFMESAGVENSLVFSSSTPVTMQDDLAAPCDKLGQVYQHACFQYLSYFLQPLFEAEGIGSGTEQLNILLGVCISLPTTTRSQCIEGFVERDKSSYRPDNLALMNLCESLSGTDKISCVVGIASRFANQTQFVSGLNYCGSIKVTNHSNVCYEKIFTTMAINAPADASSPQKICSKTKNAQTCLIKYSELTANQ
jgi:hypothetical protein